MIKTAFNILAICGAAGFSGVMLCIGLTLGGYWRSLAPAEFLDWFAANNQFVARSIPVVFLPTLIGLIGSVWLAWGSPGFRLWLASLLCLIVVAILTFAYFVPANTAFANKSVEEAATTARLNQWLAIHYARIAFAAAAAVIGCLAIAN